VACLGAVFLAFKPCTAKPRLIGFEQHRPKRAVPTSPRYPSRQGRRCGSHCGRRWRSPPCGGQRWSRFVGQLFIGFNEDCPAV
jgi:hypothetical protein